MPPGSLFSTPTGDLHWDKLLWLLLLDFSRGLKPNYPEVAQLFLRPGAVTKRSWSQRQLHFLRKNKTFSSFPFSTIFFTLRLWVEMKHYEICFLIKHHGNSCWDSIVRRVELLFGQLLIRGVNSLILKTVCMYEFSHFKSSKIVSRVLQQMLQNGVLDTQSQLPFFLPFSNIQTEKLNTPFS